MRIAQPQPTMISNHKTLTTTTMTVTGTMKRGRLLSRMGEDDRRLSDDVDVMLLNSINDEPAMKKQRIANKKGTIGTKRSKRVTFAPGLVNQVIEVPSMLYHHGSSSNCCNDNKHELFYSAQDFERFFRNEQLRRDALILTVTVGREQQKRLLLGAPLSSPTTIHQMYYKVLSRRIRAPPSQPQTCKEQRMVHEQQQQQSRTNWELCYSNSTPNSVSARCA
jgi:hypothetical protein